MGRRDSLAAKFEKDWKQRHDQNLDHFHRTFAKPVAETAIDAVTRDRLEDKIDALVDKKVQEILNARAKEDKIEDDMVICNKCGRSFKERGLKRHMRSCDG